LRLLSGNKTLYDRKMSDKEDEVNEAQSETETEVEEIEVEDEVKEKKPRSQAQIDNFKKVQQRAYELRKQKAEESKLKKEEDKITNKIDEIDKEKEILKLKELAVKQGLNVDIKKKPKKPPKKPYTKLVEHEELLPEPDPTSPPPPPPPVEEPRPLQGLHFMGGNLMLYD